MARAGEVESLMKGSLHTDELMEAVVDGGGGLRTERRMSHVFVMEVPAYPRMLLITDAAINIAPDLDAKADICRNAIDLAHVLGIAHAQGRDSVGGGDGQPEDRIDAARGGAVQDGRAPADRGRRARRAARLRQRDLAGGGANQAHRVPGRRAADILLVPDLEAGNMIAKQLTYLAGADSAGIVLGARVPIVLTSRADNVRTRLASPP